ncbi:MarR family winged helix-turn-helix transcriptional regulator [Fusobacterium sp.]|uniref:MarR family winged helix-turn-helix transcriptional regulator n=1 Tax=Fusobacterium sp. TaxID=68766 RepID=UPI002902B2F7|nr:MarR family transcriptional regulator [Fusobacterium sp.]MDU1912476.1 MarR family transcriptional regulator [Fusobacterium sp.]
MKNALIELQCEMVAERTYVNPNNLSWLQYDILHFINLHKNTSPSKLSVELGVARSKLSKALKQLKLLEYIQQVPSDLDGRELITSLTQSGNEFLINIYNNHESIYKLSKEIFSEEEQEEFARLAKMLSNKLRNERIKNNE